MRRAIMQKPGPPADPQAPTGGDLPGGMTYIGSLGRQIATNTLRSVKVQFEAELSKAARERGKFQAQLEKKGGDDPVLEARIDKLDADVIRLQAGIIEINDNIIKLNPVPGVGTLAGGSQPQPTFPPNPGGTGMEDMIIAIIGIIFVGFPLSIAFARIMWKRASHSPPPNPALAADSTRRFDHLEQSVDAIAIEVERISENQRYLTKLLSEGRPVAVSAGSVDSSKSH